MCVVILLEMWRAFFVYVFAAYESNQVGYLSILVDVDVHGLFATRLVSVAHSQEYLQALRVAGHFLALRRQQQNGYKKKADYIQNDQN